MRRRVVYVVVSMILGGMWATPSGASTTCTSHLEARKLGGTACYYGTVR